MVLSQALGTYLFLKVDVDANVKRGTRVYFYFINIMSVQCRLPGFTVFVALGCTKSDENFKMKHKTGKGVNVS